MPSEPDNFWTRRRWLKGSAATGIGAFVAGCASSEDEGTPDDTPDDSSDDTSGGTDTPGGQDESVDAYFLHPAWYGLADSNFNIFGETYNLWLSGSSIFDRLAYMSRADHTPYPQALKSYEVGDEALTLTLREGLSWHSGQSFTAQDVANHIRLQRLFGPPFSWVEGEEGVEVVDDHTLKWHFASNTNTNMAYYSMLELDYYHVATHPELHREFIERERDATSEDQRKQIRNDLAQFVIPPEDAVETVGNGPLKLVKANEKELVMEPYPDYPPLAPDSDAEGATTSDEEFGLNFNGVRALDVGSGSQAGYRAALSDEVDYVDGEMPPKVREQLPDNWELLDPPTENYMFGFCFGAKGQFGDDTEKDRLARQAIAHLYDPNPWITLVGGDPVAKLVEPNHVTGLTGLQIERWIPDSVDEFTHYGYESRPEKAATLLQAAGYERDSNDQWLDSSGEQLRLEIYFDNSRHFDPAIANIAQQFSEFGLSTAPHGMAYTPYYNFRMDHELDFGLAYPGGGPHPYYGFYRNLGTLSAPWWYNHEYEEYTVPWPPGDPDGSTKSVSVNEKINELATDLDADREEQLITELAWVFNQWVPMVSTQPVMIQRYTDTRDWDVGLPFSDPRTGGYTDTAYGQTLRMMEFGATQ